MSRTAICLHCHREVPIYRSVAGPLGLRWHTVEPARIGGPNERCPGSNTPLTAHLRPGQGEDALGEVVQEFPGGDSRAAGSEATGGRGG